jgi:peptide/nickel transport system ATP-binding protein
MRRLLEVENLTVYYHTSDGPVRAVDGVSFSIGPGEWFGIVGESGSGKSTIAFALLRLIKPPGRIERGRVLLESADLLQLSEESMRNYRLTQIALIAQGAMNALNPVKRIRDHFVLALKDHGFQLSDSEYDRRIAALLERVGLRPEVARLYPHELSGGMKQRVCIALAISLEPKVLVADEPTSALDVVVQWQVMETLRAVQREIGAAVLLIGHDMGLIAQTVDRIGVMYAGCLVEIGPTSEILRDPLHPYTQALIASLPSLDAREELRGIPGLPPSLLRPPPGCAFHPRCPVAVRRCQSERPLLREVCPGRWVACHLVMDGGFV